MIRNDKDMFVSTEVVSSNPDSDSISADGTSYMKH